MAGTNGAVPPSVLHRTARLRASEATARQIADLVLRRTIAEGARLPSEAVMAAELGVSRSTVREALRLLESWGLVRVERGRGKGSVVRYPAVADMTRSLAMVLDTRGISLAEVTESRVVIESACIRLAAIRHDEVALRALLTAVDEAEAGRVSWEDHTVVFHGGLARATGNVVLETVVASLSGLIRFSAALVSEAPEGPDGSLRAHRRIAEALLAGRPERAERRLVRHLEAFLELMQRRYAVDVGTLTAGLMPGPTTSGRPLAAMDPTRPPAPLPAAPGGAVQPPPRPRRRPSP